MLKISVSPLNCQSLNSLEFPGYIKEEDEEESNDKKGKLVIPTEIYGAKFSREANSNSNRDAILGMFCKSGSEQRGLVELRKAFNVEPFQIDVYPNNCNNDEELGINAEGERERRRMADHPITGNTIPTFNLLIKVKRRVRKRHPDSQTAPEEKLEASLVGVVNKTLRFRSLADFQVEMPQDDDIAQLLSNMVDLDVEKMNEFHFRPNSDIPEDSASLLYPSPSYCRLDIPSDYFYKENPHVSTIVQRDATGKKIVQVVSRFRSKKLETSLTQIVQESDEKYPSGPLPDLPDLEGDELEKPDIFTGDSIGRIKSLVERLSKCFNERPICTRLYLSNNLKLLYTDDKALFKALQYVAYSIPFGPWRGCWVKYGVDPRSDVSFRVYQTMDMRSVNGRSSKAVKKIVKAKEAKKLLELNNITDTQSHIFDGHNYTHCRTFQLIDLIHPDFKSLVNSIAYCRNEANSSKDGWYIEGHLAVIREKLKNMINQVKMARMERLISAKGAASDELGGESSADDMEDEAEGTGAMLHNFFDQLGDEDEFDILEDDD